MLSPVKYFVKNIWNDLPFFKIHGKIGFDFIETTKGGAKEMPNIKSAIKRVSVIEKKTLQNNMIKSAYKSAVKKFEQAVEAGNKEEAAKLFSAATKKVDQACTKGVIVKNTAARKKSNMAKKLNAMA